MMEHRSARDEQGAALVTVLGVTFVLTLLVATMLVTVINLNRATFRDADFHAALGAAEAGIDDLIFALNADPAYWEEIRDGTADRPAFSDWTGLPGEGEAGEYRYEATSYVEQDGTIELLVSGRVGERVRTLDVTLRRRNFLDYLYFTEYETRPPAAYNTWPPLEDDNEYSRLHNGEWVHGNSNNSQNLDGNVEVAFVGADAQEKAEEQCSWHRYGSGRPADTAEGTPGGLQVPSGTQYPTVSAPVVAQAIPDGRSPRCHEPHWVNNDDFQGPLHSNDAFPIRGNPRFRESATSSWAAAPEGGFLDVRGLINNDTAGSPRFDAQDNRMLYAPPLRMPPSNDQLRQVAANDGCLLRGPTRLHLHRHDSRGAIGINSPRSPGVQCGGATLTAEGYARVYVDDIENGVLFVDNDEDTPEDGEMLADGLPMEGVDSVGIPDWSAGLGREDVTPYFSWHGDALVSGELEGRLTIGAGHDLIIVGDITYRGTDAANRHVPDNDDTLLGMIANRFVYLFNPVECMYRWNHLTLMRDDDSMEAVCLHGRRINYDGDGQYGGGLNAPRVYGAILSVQYSLTIQNSGLGGGRGRLHVIGAMGQQYRGNLGTAPDGYYLTPGVGTHGSRCGTSNREAGYDFTGVDGDYCSAGFGKEFTYDTRLRYLSPPHFLNPLETAWRVSQYSEADLELFE